MKELLQNIRQCAICKEHLPLGPRPVVSANPDAKIIIIGQAPGTSVHKTGIPWDDPSGKQLRNWLNVTENIFYDETKIALMPMGFCYTGKGKSGDLQQGQECEQHWYQNLLYKMHNM